MTDTTRRNRIIRQIIVTLGLAVVGTAAFSMSFDAQRLLTVAAGTPTHLAWFYPLTVDAAIVIVSLIAAWNDHPHPNIRRYLYAALGLWTTISVAGNALHILALPPGRLTIPFTIAIAVNTVPAVTLFLTIHIAVTTVYRRPTTPSAGSTSRRRNTTPDATPSTKAGARRSDIPAPSIEELMALSASGLSTGQIADQIQRSKSWTAKQIKDERERRAVA